MRAINAGDMNDLINFILQEVSRLVAVFVHKESLVLFWVQKGKTLLQSKFPHRHDTESLLLNLRFTSPRRFI